MRWPSAVITVAYLLLAALTAAALAAYGSFNCYEECRPNVAWPGWRHDRSAWQWGAMSWLGVSSLVAAIAFAVTAWRARSSAAAIALTVQLAAATAGGLLVHASGQESVLGVALVLAGLAALGSVLIVTRRRPNSQPG
jgi:hypothetical protein